MFCEGKQIMPKSLVGKVKNKRFAFFWLLIGGSTGNVLMALRSLEVWPWPMLLPSAILSILIAMAIADKTKRPKIWLGIDLLLTSILLMLLVPFFGAAEIKVAISLPGILIIFGCILGIIDW
jgi:hypothetical protein